MSPKPSENGTEGDDEREEGEEDTEEDKEEQEEEEEDEPRLKYQRMGGNVPSLLSSDAASCVAVAERMIALGTHGGTVHILDFLGNQVNFCVLFHPITSVLCVLLPVYCWRSSRFEINYTVCSIREIQSIGSLIRDLQLSCCYVQ